MTGPLARIDGPPPHLRPDGSLYDPASATPERAPTPAGVDPDFWHSFQADLCGLARDAHHVPIKQLHALRLAARRRRDDPVERALADLVHDDLQLRRDWQATRPRARLPRRYRVQPGRCRVLTASGEAIPNGYAEHLRQLRG